MAPDPAAPSASEAGPGPSTSTAPTDEETGGSRAARGLRRLFVCALTAFLVLGLLGVFGPRSGARSAAGGGWDLSVDYPKVSRPGLATSTSLEVRHPGGFDTPVVMAVTSSWLDLFSESDVEPEPVSSTADASHTVWTFEPPGIGDTLVVTLSGRVQPGAQLRSEEATVTLIDGDRPAVSVSWKTSLMP